MLFTKDQIDEIRRRLAIEGKKDTQFNPAKTPFTGNEILSIVQGGENKKITLSQFIEAFDISKTDIKIKYTTCNTSSNVQYKQVRIDDFKLEDGILIAVTFTYANVAKNAKLVINGTHIAPLYYLGEPVAPYKIVDNNTILILYNQESVRFNIISGITSDLVWF